MEDQKLIAYIMELFGNSKQSNRLRSLFSQLNYEAFNQAINEERWDSAFAKDQLLRASIINQRDEFKIIHAVIALKKRYGRDYLPRSAQREIIGQLQNDYPYSLIVFSDKEERFYDFCNLKLLVTEDGEKRTTQLLRRIHIETGSPKRTAVERLALLKADSDNFFELNEQHNKAFDVDAVTKEFYKKYEGLYKRLVGGVLLTSNRAYFGKLDKKQQSSFAQRLLGRVMFLYFLQRKGWLGDRQDFLIKEFQRIRDGGSFYRDVLETIWFRCLNTPEGERDKSLLPKEYQSVPYLNGGLFEPKYNYDGGDMLPIDNSFFSTDKYSQGEGEGVLDIFNSYNFTIEESSPLEQEVAVDPEMLGKVLENLLEVEQRKTDGVYYTPRPIVDFMCRESLLGHLADDTSLDREKLEQLFKSDLLAKAEWAERQGQSLDYDLTPREAKQVIESLEQVKVLDPAIGSGAFPLGMMHSLMQVHRAAHLIRGSRLKPDSSDAADLKQRIIAKNLYGTDINPTAIEVARLRLWLSLVVDQQSLAHVEPLPNLDFKFMAGDSLIEEIEGVPVYPVAGGEQGELHINSQLQAVQAKLIKLEQSFFRTHNSAERKRLEADIHATVHEFIEAIVDQSLRRIAHESKTVQLALAKRSTKKLQERQQQLISAEAKLRGLLSQALNPEQPLPFFPFRLFFGEAWADDRKGFDIVIANPPYVRQESFSAEYKAQLQTHYDAVYTKTCDIYVPFYKRGFELLRPGGYLSFISSGTYARTGFGKKLRGWLRDNTTLLSWLDFGDLQPFEGQTTYPVVPVIKNAKAPAGHALRYYQLPDLNMDGLSAKVAAGSHEVVQADLADDGYRFLKPEVKAVFDKIVAAGKPLKEVVGEIYRGVLTGLNEAFIVDGPTKDRLIAEDPTSEEVLKPLLMGRDLKPWRYDFQDRWLVFTRQGIDIDAYPAIKRHLEQYKERLMPRPKGAVKAGWKGRKPGSYEWYEIQDTVAYYKAFEGPKVMWAHFQREPKFMYDEAGMYCNDKAYILPTDKKQLISLLNSNLMWLYIITICPEKRGKTFEVRIIYSENFPISEKALNDEKFIAQALISQEEPTAENLKKLNDIVYSLYGLNASEQAIIEREIESLASKREGS